MLFIHLINVFIENLLPGAILGTVMILVNRPEKVEHIREETGSSEPLPLTPAPWEEGQSTCVSR